MADVFDEDALAEVGASASLWARERALQLAAQYEAYVRLHVTCRPEYEEEAQTERDHQQQQNQEDSVGIRYMYLTARALIIPNTSSNKRQNL